MVIAQALTSSRPNLSPTSRVKIDTIGNTRDGNLVSEATVEMYITYADSQIDGVLTQMYFTPFKKCAHGEWFLDEDINTATAGTDVVLGTDGLPIVTTTNRVVVTDSCNLVAGEQILIHDDSTGAEELHIISLIIDQNTFDTVDDIEGSFTAENGVRVIRLKFPPPLNQISARYAASFIYDKYFAAQAQPNVSDYGKEMRAVASGQLNDILNGKTEIKCGKRKGDMMGNPWISSIHSVQQPYGGFATTDRDMSKPK